MRVNLPPEIAEHYSVVSDLTSGGESDVVLVRPNGDPNGRPLVLKLYRHGIQPDLEALARIRTLPAGHVIEIVNYGESAAGWWELQEYVEQGSLADLFVREGSRLNPSRLQAVITELAEAVSAVHPVLHRDVKPANVLVRRLQPLDLVLSDFGLARITAQTHIVSSIAGSLAYQSPEALDGGASSARDWWAVGMIIAEAAIGRHPFYDPKLGWPPAPEMRIALTTRPVPLDGIDDERVRLLCRGLLVRDPRRRWGAAEVRAWLRGDDPHVDDEPARVAARPEPAIQPFVFAGQRCTAPDQLAPLLAQHWDDALRLLSGAPSEAPDYVRLVIWLQDHDHQPALRVLTAAHDRSFARRLFRLLRALDPSLPPSFRGHVIDREGLLELARAATSDGRAAVAVIDDLRQLGILGELAREASYLGLAAIEADWNAQIELLRQLRGQLGPIGAPLDDDGVMQTACSRILLMLLDEAELDRLSDIVVAAEGEPELLENDELRALYQKVVLR